MEFAQIEEALSAFARGEFVIVVDDEDRENEGDLCLAAQAASSEKVNFMMAEARGLICVAMEPQRLDDLELPPMMEDNTSRYRTAFAVSVDAAVAEHGQPHGGAPPQHRAGASGVCSSSSERP